MFGHCFAMQYLVLILVLQSFKCLSNVMLCLVYMMYVLYLDVLYFMNNILFTLTIYIS